MVLESPRVRVVSVNVGRPRHLGFRHGRPIDSAIDKRAVTAATLRLGEQNLEGDEQADLRVHGGVDKAVHVQPVENLRTWAEQLSEPGLLAPGSIGENLTVEGWDETEVGIGDVWAWGDALLQVCQPRMPCFKLAMRTGHPEVVRMFEHSGRSGWYLRVLRPGTVPCATPFDAEIVRRDPAGLSVRDAQRLARAGQGSAAAVRAAAEHPALAAAWARALTLRLSNPDTAAS